MRTELKSRLMTLMLAVLAGVALVSCNGDKNLKKGEQYWAIGEYYEAAQEYAKAYAKTPASQKDRRGMIAYKVAESNRRMNYYAKAQAGYRNAVRYKYVDTLTYFYLAEMERYNKEYKQAARDYQLYLDAHPGHRLSLVGLESCEQAPLIKERGSSYTVKEDKNFKSTYMDYSPSFNGDDIYFSSTRRDCNGDDVNGITGMKSGDIFYMQKDDKGKWKRYEAVDEKVNSKYDEGACCFTPDGKTMYFTRCRVDATYPRYAEIYSSPRNDASWGEAKICTLSKDTLSSYAHPAVSPKGDYLYFVSDMPGGFGGLDLWRVSLNGSSFGAVENLGADINTDGDEMFPTFRPNGDLYFSSNGRVGMGGLDIYKAVMDTVTNRWDVSHLPYPVNSNGDDFGMTFNGEHNQGFFSSNRSNRRGWDKIYSFYCPEVVQTVKGWVYEQDGYELPKAVVYVVGDDGTNKKATIQLDGSFEETVKPGVRYLFLATCEGYMNYKQELQVPQVDESEEYVLQFPLPSLDIPVLVRNVFYEFDKANITPQSIPALEGLVGLLKQNPGIVIELSSHCDYRGSDDYNEKLSQARAESVVRYLTTHGIPQDRVVAKGYGKKRPKVITKKFAERYPFLKAGDTLTVDYIKKLNETQQDTCNALNRRTEFTVLKTTYGMLDKKGDLNADAVRDAVKAQKTSAAPQESNEASKDKPKSDTKAPADTKEKPKAQQQETKPAATSKQDSVAQQKKSPQTKSAAKASKQSAKATQKAAKTTQQPVKATQQPVKSVKQPAKAVKQ
jgi:outer membrane protein OmpA-like peptidoglycan-associated protein